jgi:hypothetical protein
MQKKSKKHYKTAWAKYKHRLVTTGKLEEHREKERLKVAAWRKKNRVKEREKLKQKRLTDPCYVYAHKINSKLRRAIKNPEYNANLGPVGCTAAEFRAWIEAQFTPQMNWQNHGNYDADRFTWQLDHICPWSRCNGNMKKLKELLHFKNIRPIEARTNIIERGR